MPKTIPQILDFGSSSTLSSTSSQSLTPAGILSHIAPTPSPSESQSTSKIRTSHLLQHRPKKRKRTPVIQDEETNTDSSLSESTQRQLDASKQILYNVIDRVLDGQTLGHSLSFLYGRVEAVCRYKHNEQKALAEYLFGKLDEYFETLTSKQFPDFEELEADNLINGIVKSVLIAMSICQRIIDDWKSWSQPIMKLSQVFAFLEKNYLRPHHSRKSIVKYGETKFADFYFEKGELSVDSEGEVLHERFSMYSQRNQRNINVVFELYSIVARFHYCLKFYSDTHHNAITQTFKDMTTIILRLPLEGARWTYLVQAVVSTQFELFKVDSSGWFCNEDYKKASNLKRKFMIIEDEIGFYKSCGVKKQVLDYLASKLTYWLIFRDDFTGLVLDSFEDLLDSPSDMKLLKKMCLDVQQGMELNGEQQLCYVWKEFSRRKFQKAIDEYQSGLVDTQVYPNVIIYLHTISKDLEEKVALYGCGGNVFGTLVSMSLGDIINKSPNNTYIIQQLCKLCDLYFKSKLTNVIDSLVDLWRTVSCVYLPMSSHVDFLTVYKKDLSRRLILGKTSNITEEHKLAKLFLTFVYGNEIFDTITSMFENMQSSDEVYAKLIRAPGLEFKPVVLEKATWTDIPNQNLSSIPLPSQFANVLNKFGQAFSKADERNGRKQLDWSNYKLHQLTIAGHFNSGEKSINANMLQAMVILLFNESDEYTFEQILEKTKMDSPLLQAVINTMVTGRCKILKQEGNVIKFNKSFKDKSKTIKLPAIKESSTALAPTKATTDKEVAEIIERNRTEEFKSVVVRIMKQSKTLSMTDLLNQSIEILQKRRPVSIIDLKSAIERLITDEFLKRKNRDTIEYTP